ncbi:MAG: hypothetical protein ACK5O2_04295 [Microthrixaceae bacterium]
MKFRTLSRDAEAWSPLELHPSLTVVVFDDDAIRVSLIETLSHAYDLAGSEVHGMIEYSGFDMPLDQTSVVSLDLVGDGPPLVDQEVLVGVLGEVRDELRRRIEPELERKATELGELMEDLHKAKRRSSVTAAAVEAVDEDLGNGAVLLGELESELVALDQREIELHEAVGTADEAIADQGALRAHMEQIVPSLRDRMDSEGEEMSSLRIGDPTEELRAELAGVVFTDDDRRLGEELIDWLEQMGAGSAQPSSAVVAHLEEIRELEARWDEVSSIGVEGDPAVVAAREAHDRAHERLTRLEGLAESGLLAERARAEIDEAHELGDPERELEVLERYGFESHLDYTVVISTRSVGDALSATLQDARTSAGHTTDVLEAARAAAVRERDELGDRRDRLREQLSARTGVDPEELTEEALSLIPEAPQAAGELDAALERALDYAHAVSAELEERRRLALAELAELDQGGVRVRIEGERRRLVELESLREQAEVVRLNSAADHDRIEADRVALAAEVAGIETSVGVLEGSGDSLGDGLVGAVAEKLEALLAPGGHDPAPAVLVPSEDPSPWSAGDLTMLGERLATFTQVIHLTDDETVIRWARKLPAVSGSVLRPGKRTWFGRRLARRHKEHSEVAH